MTTLYDAYGRAVDTGRLKKQQAAAEFAGLRNIYSVMHPAAALTPERLAGCLRQAEYGDPYLYLELAEDMEERDLHYLAVLSTRKEAVAQLDPIVRPASSERNDVKLAAFVHEALVERQFDLELLNILDAIGKGFSVTEIIWDQSGRQWLPERLLWRDPHWFMFDWISGEQILVRTLRTEGPPIAVYPYSEAATVAPGACVSPALVGIQPATALLYAFKFVTHIARAKAGLPIRGGLARAAGWSYLFKSYALKDWAAFAEVYGQPLRVGKYGPGATEEDKQALLSAVANIGTDAAAIIPDSMLIEFTEAKTAAASAELYERFCQYLDAQVSKAVLGQTLTTEVPRGSGSRAAAQVHDQVRRDILASDAKRLAATLNRDLVRPIVDLNYGPQRHYPRLTLNLTDDVDLRDYAAIVAEMADRGLRVAQNDVRAKLGLSAPEDGEEVLTPSARSNSPRAEATQVPQPE